ncbi:MAG TPA: hypothetical protein VL125_10925 [Pelobium sp.]|nr:hypothetical protein [Pelobium sp.]
MSLATSFLSFLFENKTKKKTSRLNSNKTVFTNKEKTNAAKTLANIATRSVSINVLYRYMFCKIWYSCLRSNCRKVSFVFNAADNRKPAYQKHKFLLIPEYGCNICNDTNLGVLTRCPLYLFVVQSEAEGQKRMPLPSLTLPKSIIDKKALAKRKGLKDL